MRLIVLILFSLATLTHASDMSIRTFPLQGKTAYMLDAGAFSVQQNAEDLKAKLSATTKYPVKIDYLESKKLYSVQIGPFLDYKEAAAVRDDISDPVLASELAPSNIKPLVKPIAENPSPATPSKRVWNLRNADIRAVIGEVSRLTGKNFIIDPRVQGKISIASGSAISNQELYQVFLSMLQVSGYAAIPSRDAVKIVPSMDAKAQALDFPAGLAAPPKGDEVVVEVVEVHYVPAEQLVPVLRPLMPPTSNVSAYGPSNRLILSGRASNIKQLAAIIKQVDSSSTGDIDIVPLRHALAMDIVNTLKDLVKATGVAGGSMPQTTLAADDRSNAVLISASKTERIKLRMLIAELDRENHAGNNSTTQVVYLSYRRAEDLVPILAGIAKANYTGVVGTTIGKSNQPVLDSTAPISLGNNSQTATSAQPSANSTRNGQQGNATTNQTEASTKPTVQIIAEPNTNSIIINAPITVIRVLKSVISQLDIRPSQILIEALVAEINESDFKDLGIEWGSTTTGQDNTSTFNSGFAIINSKTRLRDFQAQLSALARDKRANILSTPSVVVLDNRQAKILIGKQVSVASTTYPNNANGTAPASPYTTFDRVDVALHLYVRPQITRGSGIELQIDEGNNTLEGSVISGDFNPTFNISSIVTSVHIDSGDMVVLGGLKQDQLNKDDYKMPILGDIPGIGRLFQHNKAGRERKILMVFIRPKIVKDQNDAIQVTGSKYQDMRDTQLQFTREQEEYDPRNQRAVLPARDERKLPKPFAQSHKRLKRT